MSQIIEIGVAVSGADGVCREEYQRRIKPTVEIKPNAQRCHGLTAKILSDEADRSVVLPELLCLFTRHLTENSIGVIVSHNGFSCDFPFLLIEFERAELSLPPRLDDLGSILLSIHFLMRL